MVGCKTLLIPRNTWLEFIVQKIVSWKAKLFGGLELSSEFLIHRTEYSQMKSMISIRKQGAAD